MNNNIELIMTSRGLTRAQLARAAGISYNTIYRAINGEDRIKTVTKVKISKALKVQLDEIYPEFKKKEVKK